MPEVRDLGLILDSGVPLVVIETHEEQRVLELATQLAIARDWTVFTWSATAGLRREPADTETPAPVGTRKPEGVLEHLRDEPAAGLYVLFDFHPYFAEAPYRPKAAAAPLAPVPGRAALRAARGTASPRRAV